MTARLSRSGVGRQISRGVLDAGSGPAGFGWFAGEFAQ